jgi:cell wall-associated NlpC family hydrolase
LRRPRRNRFRPSRTVAEQVRLLPWLALGTVVGLAFAIAAPVIELVATRRSRYLVHGAVTAIGVATLALVVTQPRPGSSATLTPEQLPAAPDQAATEDASAPDPMAVQPAERDDPPLIPEIRPRQAPKPPAPQHHAVEDGENLRVIAAKFGLSPLTILAANALDDPDLLMVGQDLLIPPVDGALHTLKPGESIASVAEHYGVDVGNLVKVNDLGADPGVVLPGTTIVVPGVDPMVDPYAGEATDDGGDAAGGSSDQQAASTGPATALRAHGPIPSTRTYEVQPGDTLAGIADTFGVDVDTILSNNGIADPDTVLPGVDLRILPVKGVEYTVEPDETLADIAWKYQVDLGVLLDYNDLNDPDLLLVGTKIVVPGGHLRAPSAPAPVAASSSSVSSSSSSSTSTSTSSGSRSTAASSSSASSGSGSSSASARSASAGYSAGAAAAPKPKPAAAAPAAAPAPVASAGGGGGGGSVVGTAMRYVGSRYVFGGTGPSGFDCSGFVYYVMNNSGSAVGRGMWQQYNAGAHVSQSQLKPGDVVFFANTYMPGLSHDGIYIGNGQFVHAADEGSGVTVSSINSSYWQNHYVGATRIN